MKYAENAISIKNRKNSLPFIAEAKQQEVNLHCWMERFKGVASKYLQNYWNWYASLLNLSLLKQETEHFSRMCTSSRSLTRYYVTKKM